ncbi:FKBP-type peptidyl-prolyl cis-trans isomerase N-terminal domain-containing protein [Tundrisphaera lichenicola]|uniref:FKBP-type peptidyl-prolyl cis-trans isomerase N-terminal domain-containing protein n=1 Tax=Tundrisphaera lichenicola TaxID=2029860 RepID=UPI003EBCD639
MKIATLATLGIGLLIGSTMAWAQDPAAKGESELKTVDQKAAYAIGLNMGKQMKKQGIALDPELLLKGLRDGLADKAALTDAQMEEVMQAFGQQMQAKAAAAASGIAEKSLKEGQAFLAANKAKPGVQTLPSGLQYKVIKEGTGKSPKLDDTVVAHYEGTLIDGTIFDSSIKRGEPAEFPVSGVIKGWTEILQKMKVGAKYQVFIPSDLAYGANPRPGGPIKPNDALIFDIELIDVK